MGLKDAWKGLFNKQVAPTTKKPTGGEIGFTGNKIFSGYPLDEYNQDLVFPHSTQVYDQMRRSDGQVAAVLQAMKLPIRSTNWSIEPEEGANNEKLAQDIADFIDDNFFGGMKYSWDDHLREALLMLDFGFSVFEKVYRFDTWNGKPVVMLDKYAPRVAPSIWRFPQDENYNIVKVEQINYMTGQIADMPLEKCRVYTYNREGDNIAGMSVLRPAYQHWYIKSALYKIMAVGVEKTLIGTPYATLPEGTSDDARDKILNLLNSLRVAEEAGATIPEGVVLDVLEGKKNAVDAMPFIEHHDTLIARSVLAQFINLGTMSSASGGAYALGQTMADMFCMGLEAIANYIQSEVQKDIDELVMWNFGENAPIPKLNHKNISFQDMSQVAQALYYLGAGHLINPDEDMENYIRDLFGIPPIPEAALQNQINMPPNRYDPPIVPDRPLTPQEIESMKQAQQTQAKPPQQMHEHQHHDHSIMFDDGGEMGEPVGTTKWRRDLTPLEKVVNLAEINDRWSTAEEKVSDQMRQVIRQSADNLLKKIKDILDSNQSINQKNKAISDLEEKYGPKYVDMMRKEIQQLYQYGSDQVAKELGEEPKTVPQSDLQGLYTKAEVITAAQLSRLKVTLQTGAIDGLMRGKDTKRIYHEISMAADAYSQGPGINASASVTVGESINLGRGAQAHAQGVKGAQWSAILDQKTCDLCADLDGKKIKATDPDFDIFRPPVHPNCRCIWVYIGNNNTGEVYNWETPPAALVKKYGRLIT